MTTYKPSRRSLLIGSLTATLCLALAQPAEAAEYVRIEEDWELILNTPDLSFPAPQIVVSMKPGQVSTKQALFLINHHDSPSFNAGGGQIQLWDQDVLRTYKSFAGPTLIREGEVVTWTQYMERSSGKFHFGLSAVEGEAWGTNTATTLGGPISWSDWKHTFDHYDSNLSATGATITFGDERLQSLKLLQVRKYRFFGDTNPDVEGSKTVFPLAP